jgi:penicillin-insensitive murein endopeptidase
MSLRSICLFLLFFLAGPALANPWAAVPGPSEGPPRAIGDTSAGCISGAEVLPQEGEGYVVMHLERRRYFGHPDLVDAIKALGRRAAGGLGLMHVGDLGMPRGGPMPFGHRSHQSGLDADVWFDLSPTLHLRANSLRSNVSARSLLSSAAHGLDYSIWSDRHAQMLKSAALLPSVDRIFVNAHIKQELCDTARGDTSWLRKIRPWYHHDDHFHMRLACPDDSPDCERQKPIPPGDGCDELGWWLGKEPAPSTGVKPPPEPKPGLPAECRMLLRER